MPEYRLLLVDDEPNILSALRRLLRREAYTLHVANSGEEALAILARERIDLVLADGRMPGMSGIELIKKVKASYPEAMRIILSGYTDVGELAGAINEGEVYRFILKPWNDEELKLTLRRALEHRGVAEENQQLYQRVKQQNEELKHLNASLEQAVEEKTRELLIRNQVLSIAQEILDQLPLGVIGVDATGRIVQANRRAHEHEYTRSAHVGTCIRSCLPQETQRALLETIATGRPQVVVGRQGRYDLLQMCSPLASGGEVRGAILILHDVLPEPAS